MKIYQTTDMERAIHKLIEMYGSCVVFNNHCSSKKKIKLRREKLEGLRVTTGNPYSAYYGHMLKKWETKGGVFIYNHAEPLNKIPMCNAMVFVEAPLSYRTFDKFSARATSHVVVYRPPTWEIQEGVIELKYPSSGDKQHVYAMLKNTPSNVTDLEKRAALFSGFKNAISLGRLQTSLHNLRQSLKGERFRWLQEYRFNYKPEEGYLLEDYLKFKEIVEAQYGFVSADATSKFIRHSVLQLLLSENAVSRCEIVILFDDLQTSPAYALMDAKNVAAKSEWFKMKNLVEGAELI